jgi:hypothetical protein
VNVVFHTGLTPGWAQPLDRPWPLLPVGNRPWMEYWIEWCVVQEFRSLHVVLGDGAYEIEDYLGDGSRWGVTIHYHFNRDEHNPDAFLRRSPELWRDGLFVVSRPVFPRRLNETAPALLTAATYAAFRGDDLDVFYSRDPAAMDALIAGHAPVASPFPADTLSVFAIEDLMAYFDLNMAMVDGEIARYLTPGYQREDRAYLGYNVQYPVTARLVPPLMIGNDVRLRSLCTIGPRVILGSRVIVDRQAEVTDSMVLDGTYLGAGIELKGRIVAGSRLIDPTDGTAIDLDDTHLLAPLREAGAHGEKARRLAHRFVALLLFVGVAPLAIPSLLLGRLFGGRMKRRAILGVRGSCVIEEWHPGRYTPKFITRFSFHEWTLLLRVVRGQLWLSGQLPVKPNEEDEVRRWPTYRPGLFSYADLRPNRNDPVLRRIEAAYYAYHRGWGEDARILLHGWWSRLAGHTEHTDDQPGDPA